MTKNILDHAEQSAEGSRVEKFAEKDRADLPSDAAKALQRRPRAEHVDETRTQQYLKIDRESDA